MSDKQYNRIEAELQMVLEDMVASANQSSQFSQRQTELTAERFTQLLVLGWLRQGDASLKELAQMGRDLGCDITGSAIHERIGSAAVELLGRVLVGSLRQRAPVPRIPLATLASFSAVYVTDSTQIALPATLRVEFQGANGDAMVKLQVTLDYLTGQWVALEVVNGIAPDQNSALALEQAQVGSLNLFDLGYFKQDLFAALHAQGAYFVSRYQTQTALYEAPSGVRFDVVAWLQALVGDSGQCQLELASRVHAQVRWVARRVPQALADARRRKAKKSGKSYTKSYLYLLQWDLLITNLDSTAWSLTQIFDLYPIRTQIEWLFRIWKSQLQVDHFGKWRLERVLCQLYAHLIAILLCHRLSAAWLWRDGYEYSFYKCVQIIQDRVSDLMTCIAHNWRGVQTWHRNLEAAFLKFGRKTKRKKAPSTYQTLMDWSLS